MSPAQARARLGRLARLWHGRLLGAALLLVLVALNATAEPLWLGILRFAWFDLCQRLAPRTPLLSPVVIVEVDDRSLDRHGQWPWPRTLVARLVDVIAEGRPAAIGLDLLMPERDRLSPANLPALVPSIGADLARQLEALPGNEAALAAALRGRPVVLAVGGVDGTDIGRPAAGPTTPIRVGGADARPFLRAFDRALRSVDEIDRAGSGHGLINVEVDGGAVRRLPLVARVGDALMPALGLEMLRVGARQTGLGVDADAGGVRRVRVGDLVVPTQADGSVWLRYAPPLRKRFVSAADVLARAVEPDLFDRQLVLVGVTALGLEGAKPIAGGGHRHGLEIHAELIEGLIDGAFLARPGWSPAAESAFLLVGGLLAVALVPVMPRAAALVVLAPALLIALLGSLAAYHWHSLLLDALGPSAGLILVFGATLGVTLAEVERRRAETERQREFVKRAFQHYVSPEVVEQIVEQPDRLRFGGELRTLTVLFSDIRDFTTFTERTDPQVVVEMLREYLTAMTRVVLEEGGTLDKYIGDAVMAEFGAPVAQPDHALRGCRAALRMRAEVRRLEACWTAEGRPPFRVGLGVNTGPMVVGNLGSEQLFDYTVIGDEVNLAARLESLNKEYPTSTQIIISEATRLAAGEGIRVKRLGEVRVKGKRQPVVIYELLGLAA